MNDTSEGILMETMVVGPVRIGKKEPLAFICGPCVIEGEEETLSAAHYLQALFSERKLPLIFKSSYDKANRSSLSSYRGPGIVEGLRILAKVKEETSLPVVTDVHSTEEASAASACCDLLQIPAFLCRQTDLVVGAAATGCPVSIKKGQFMAPWEMKNVVDKVRSTNNRNLLLIERGSSFGYQNLVVDMRSLLIMQSFGLPVCFDATHAVQLPGALGSSSGGQREYIPLLARAAVAAGIQCLFLEAHPDPSQAKSDSSSMISFADLPYLLDAVQKIHELVQPYC